MSLQENHQELQKVTDSIQSYLEPFEARKFGLSFSQGEVYSEMMEFLHYIVTLTYKDYPICEMDLLHHIKDLKVAFGFNTFQITFKNQQKFGSIFCIKEYREIPLENIDRCLQLDSELIITEIIIFTSNNKAVKEFKNHINMLQISENNTLLQNSGIKEIIELEELLLLTFVNRKLFLRFLLMIGQN